MQSHAINNGGQHSHIIALGAWAELFSITYLTVLIFGGQALSSSFRRRRRTRAALTAGVGAAFLGFAAKLAASSG